MALPPQRVGHYYGSRHFHVLEQFVELLGCALAGEIDGFVEPEAERYWHETASMLRTSAAYRLGLRLRTTPAAGVL